MAYAWTHDVDTANYMTLLSSRSLSEYQELACRINWVTVYTCLYKYCRAINVSSQTQQPGAVYPLIPKQDRRLHQLLHSLPLIQRIALTLVDIADLSYDEVSFILERDIKTVKHLISVARFKILTEA